MTEGYRQIDRLDALLMCGRDASKSGLRSDYKFLYEFGGTSCLASILTALDESQVVGNIICIGPESLIREKGPKFTNSEMYIVREAGGLWDNFEAGVNRQQQIGRGSRILLVYSDLPFLTSESIKWLITNTKFQRPLQVPVVPKSVLTKLLPYYSSYYWPMHEYPFKWADNVMGFDVNLLHESRLGIIVNQYRESSSGNVLFSPYSRLKLLYNLGGAEGLLSVLLNYFSKIMQMKLRYDKSIPFSSFRSRMDYERLLSHILGVQTSLLETPLIDVVIDVDNETRKLIFQKRFAEIKNIINQNNRLLD